MYDRRDEGMQRMVRQFRIWITGALLAGAKARLNRGMGGQQWSNLCTVGVTSGVSPAWHAAGRPTTTPSRASIRRSTTVVPRVNKTPLLTPA
jgi:hypothetical protein